MIKDKVQNINYAKYKNALEEAQYTKAEKALLKHIRYCEQQKIEGPYYYELSSLRKLLPCKSTDPYQELDTKLNEERKKTRNFIQYKKIGQAKKELKTYLEIAGNKNWEYYYLLGRIYFAEGKFKEAEINYYKALELDETNPYLYLQLHELALRLNKKEEARMLLNNYLHYNKGQKSFGIVKKIQEDILYNHLDDVNQLYYSTLMGRSTIIKRIAFSKKVLVTLKRQYNQTKERNPKKAEKIQNIMKLVEIELNKDRAFQENEIANKTPQALASEIESKETLQLFHKQYRNQYLDVVAYLLQNKEDQKTEIDNLHKYIANLKITNQEKLLLQIDTAVLLKQMNYPKQSAYYMKQVQNSKLTSYVEEQFNKAQEQIKILKK